ncbi:hypothetical protein [sulfur-oxidizing endosymbiont of Gigantopelta aegis]|uniref:hypothetical protein n=1 Tax=sulfur-oxidizing endosymbiont of Gigantopelta aegis TaxID=2794934 RepID=UPI0018DE6CB0|nr:hypothetical protein [sulfur-oxidizing endosymbiont of Gigantopelta aegis]
MGVFIQKYQHLCLSACFGGTVRSSQLLGVFKAMKLMLSGRALSIYHAKKMGLIDDVISNKIPQQHFNQLLKSGLKMLTLLNSINAPITINYSIAISLDRLSLLYSKERSVSASISHTIPHPLH